MEDNQKLQQTQATYNKLLSKINQLCNEAEAELKEINQSG